MKILFLINNQRYIQSFMESGIIKNLEKFYNFNFLIKNGIYVNKNLYIKNNIKKIYYYNKDPHNNIKLKLFDLTISNIEVRSKSFKFRLKRLYRHDLRNLTEMCIENEERINFLNRYKRFHIPIINFIKYNTIKLLSSRYLFSLTKKFFIKKISINEDLLLKIREINPDIILMPTNGYAPEIFDITKICKEKKIKYHLIIDNWDNLSSKMLLTEHPDKIYVWGKQSEIHGEKIHEINKNKIVKFGCARYKSFFEERNKQSQSPFNFRYILFTGSSWSWDEEATLDNIDKILNNNKNHFNNIKVVYRPHPFRQRKTKINKNWQNIVFDPQLLEDEIKNKKEWPNLNYYPNH